jgi:hypothetical protein
MRNSTRRRSRVPPRRCMTAGASFLRAIRSSPCIEMHCFSRLFFFFLAPSPSLCSLFYSIIIILPPPTHALAWLLDCFASSLSSIIPGVAVPTDCITTHRSFITYISALPPSLSNILSDRMVYSFVLFPFKSRIFLLPLSLCTSCVGLLSLDMCVHYPRGPDSPPLP